MRKIIALVLAVTLMAGCDQLKPTLPKKDVAATTKDLKDNLPQPSISPSPTSKNNVAETGQECKCDDGTERVAGHRIITGVRIACGVSSLILFVWTLRICYVLSEEIFTTRPNALLAQAAFVVGAIISVMGVASAIWG